MWIRHNNGARTIPWATPESTGVWSDATSSSNTLCTLPRRNTAVLLGIKDRIPYYSSFPRNHSRGTMLNGLEEFEMSHSTCDRSMSYRSAGPVPVVICGCYDNTCALHHWPLMNLYSITTMWNGHRFKLPADHKGVNCKVDRTLWWIIFTTDR